MRSSPATRRGLALFCLIAALLVAGWTWQLQHRQPPAVATPTLPAPLGTVAGAARAPLTELADPPSDPVFGQQARTPLLRRVVEMYQHDPASEGAGLRWADHPLASDTTMHRDFPIASTDFFAGVVQLDGRWLDHQAIRQLGHARRLTPQTDAIPQNMLASFSVSGDYLQSSSDPSHPQPGDLRISWLAQAWPPASVRVAGPPQAGPAAAVASTSPAPGYARWRPVAAYLLALVLLLIAAGLSLLPRRGR